MAFLAEVNCVIAREARLHLISELGLLDVAADELVLLYDRVVIHLLSETLEGAQVRINTVSEERLRQVVLPAALRPLVHVRRDLAMLIEFAEELSARILALEAFY